MSIPQHFAGLLPAAPKPDIWFDASDPNGVNKTGTTLTRLNDLSGNGNHATPTSGTVTTGVDTWAGRNVLTVPWACELSLASDWVTSDMTAIFVVQNENGAARGSGTLNGILLSTNSALVNYGYIFFHDTHGGHFTDSDQVDSSQTGAIMRVFGVRRKAGSSMEIFQGHDGQVIAAVGAPPRIPTIWNVLLGQLVGTFPFYSFVGLFAEARLFARALRTDEYMATVAELSAKWDKKTKFATWNPTDTTAGATLSNGNLTWTGAEGSPTRGTMGKSRSRWQIEMVVASGNVPGNRSIIGFGTLAATMGDAPGGDANGWGMYLGGGSSPNLYHGGAAVTTFSGYSFTDGDVIGLCLDLTNDKINVYKNGTFQFTLVSGGLIGNTLYPMVSTGSGTWTTQVTANFGPTLQYPIADYNQGLFDSPVFARWDQSISAGAVSLGGFTLNGYNYDMSYTDAALSIGKWWVEFTSTSFFRGCFGVASAISTGKVGDDNLSWGYWGYEGGPSNMPGAIHHGGVSTQLGSGTGWSTNANGGGVMNMAIDLDNRTVAYYMNGVQIGSQTLDPSGPVRICSSSYHGAVNSFLNANFGQSAFTYAPPAGFKAGFYA